MRKLNVVQSGKGSAQWKSWIGGLDDAGFEIRTLDHAALDSHDFAELFGDAIVLDGMLPHLSRLIVSICARNPDAQIIVATEIDSFTIYYEMLHLNGAIYVSGPLPTDEFVATIQSLVGTEMVA